MASLNFDEAALKEAGGSIYNLYLALYNGSVAANNDIPSDSDFIVTDADGNIDEDKTAAKISAYNIVLMKNAAYSEALSIINNVSSSGSGSGTSTGDVTQADLYNLAVKVSKKFGYQRIITTESGDSVLQTFSDQSSCDLYDTDNTTNAGLLLSSLTLPSGGGGGSSSGVVYYLRCVNNLASLTMSVAKNDECNIDFTFISKYKYPDDESYTNTDEQGKVEIYAKNSKYSDYTLVTTFEVASNTEKIFDIHSYLENGTNSIKIVITGENTGKTAASTIYTVQVTSMSLSAPNFKWYLPYTNGITIPYIISGNVSKSLIVNISGTNYNKAYTVDLGTAVYTDTAYNYIVEEPDNEGVYNISAYLQNSDASVKTKPVSFNVICIKTDSTSKFICINSQSNKIYNWAENTLFTYAIYDGGNDKTSAEFVAKKDTTSLYDVVETAIETGTSHTFTLSMELDISDTSFNVTMDVLNTDTDKTKMVSTMTFPTDNSAGYSATANSVFYLNPRTRSNSQSNYLKIVNSIDSSELDATWNNMSWANDGWEQDDDGYRLLRLISGSSVDIPYQPFATESAKIGKTIEIDYKVTNVTDYSKPIITMAKDAADGNSFVGLKIYPDNIYPCSASLVDANNQSIPTDTDVRLRVTLVLLPDAYGNSGYNLAMLFINGKRNRVFAYKDNDYWQAVSDIVIGNDYADIDIYGIRIYNFGLTSGAVLQNYVNWQSTTDEKAACVANNSIYENDGVTISFSKMKTMKNVFTFDQPFPYKGNKAGVTGTLEVFFLNETTTRKNFSITNVAASGQGTSSKTYWEWNEKFAIGSTSVITYSDGTTGSKSVLFSDGVPKCAKMTAKKNWASSMQDHKNGSVNAYTDLWKKIGLSNEAVDANSEVRVSVYQEPFIGFYKTVNDEGQTVYTCMGEFTFGPDKGDKYCFGYDTTAFPDLISIEGSDNAPAHALFQKPWNDNVAYNSDEEAFQYNGTNCWDFDGGKTDNIKYWIPVYNFIYNCSNLILPFNGTLDELNAAKETYMSTGYQYWIAKSGDANQYNLYYYDEVTQQFVFSINLKTQLVGQTFTYTDGDTAKTIALTESDITSATDNNAVNTLFVNARIAMFGQGITSRFDLNDSLFHDAFIEFVAGTDNRAKNTYTYLFSGTGLWRWRVDDLDTIFPIDNEGKLHKPYWVETHDMDATGKAYWNGEKSVFHNLLELAYPNAQKIMVGKMFDAMISLGGLKTGTYREKIYAWYEKYYLGVKEYFPEAIINADQKRYDNAKLLDTQASVDPLAQSLGDLYSCETAWVKKRIEYMMSKYSYGEYSSYGTDVISFRAAGTAITYDLTPAIKMYPTIENGTTIVRGARTEAGSVCSISINLLGTGDQPNVIEGASYLMSIGDFSGKNIEGAMAVSAKMLKELVLGNDTAANVVIAISSLTLTGCVALRTLVLTNVASLAGALDLTTCTHLKSVYANGTNLTQITLPTGSALSYVYYPSTNKYLLLKKMPVLANSGMIISGCAANIIDLLVIDCPKIDAIDLLLTIMAAQATDHALKHIRVTGFTHTYADQAGSDALEKLIALTDGTYYGLSTDGIADTTVYPKPILSGEVNINAHCYEDTVTSLREYFGSQLALNITADFYIRFQDDAVRQICATNWGDGTGITAAQAAAVSSVGTKFKENTEITSFDELQFFKINGIGSKAFNGCTSLKTIHLPDSCTNIYDSAFMNCSSLQKIDLTHVTDIGNGFKQFYSCSSLTSVGDASNITSISQSCFLYCKSLESINISNKCTYIAADAFSNCINLKSIGDVSSVNSFGRTTWTGTALTNFIIPSICIGIGDQCFYKCTSMQYIKCLADTPPSLGNYAFEYTNNCPIYVPDNSLDTYKSATNWSSYASRIKAMSTFVDP